MNNRRIHRVSLLFGSNLGDRAVHIQRAMKSVQDEMGKAEKISSLYETEPWGVSDQPNYLNAAMIIRTGHSPQQLLSFLKRIETEEGRTDQKKYASRTLDIDILFYDDLVLNSKELVVPHPKMHLRKFALVPLNEIDGELMHPVFKKSIARLLDECSDSLDVLKFGEQG
jgi:2-amino-4-hydroxy-6-hydroxymethyldihydropteridine diphosphokinase